jgi:hypothetical protein
MAKVSKKKRWYKRGYKRYRGLNNQQYFRVKAEFYSDILFPMAANSGRAYFRATNSKVVTLTAIMQNYAYTNILAGLFSYYKITGIRVEVTPDARNANLEKTIQIPNIGNESVIEPVVMVSYRSANDNEQSLTEAKANNQSIVLSPSQKITRYWRTYGASGAYRPAVDGLDGAFTVQNDYNSQNAPFDNVMYQFKTQPSWKIKISVYLLYKQSRA